MFWARDEGSSVEDGMPSAIENYDARDVRLAEAEEWLGDLIERIKGMAQELEKDAANVLRSTVQYPTLEEIRKAISVIEQAKADRQAAYDALSDIEKQYVTK